MVTICQQCGDKGFYNAFIFCVICLEVAVHRYCLFKLPKTFDECVPWACEECETDLAKRSSLKRSRAVLSLERCSTSSEHALAQVINSGSKLKGKDDAHLLPEAVAHGLQSGTSKKTSKSSLELNLSEQAHLSGNCSSLKRKAMKEKNHICSVPKLHKWRNQDNLTNRPNVSESAKVGLSYLKIKSKKKVDATSIAEHGKQEHQNSLSRKPSEEYVSHANEHTELDSHPKSQSNNRKTSDSVAEIEDHRRQVSSLQLEEYTKDLAEHGQLHGDFCPLYIVPEKGKDGIGSTAETLGQDFASSISQHLPQPCMEVDSTDCAVLMGDLCHLNEKDRSIPICMDACKNDQNLEKQRISILKDLGQVHKGISEVVNGSLLNISEGHSHVPAQPVIDPIWRGSFNICSKRFIGTFDGLVGHLSSKVCPKVCEVASLLPSLLSLEMLPKSDIWPRSFKKLEPNDDHIALYFFPESNSCEIFYDHFVEDMLGQQLAMRATVKNAELLVFTSVELPLNLWRFQGKHYLWGVFRNKSVSSSQVNHQLRVQDGHKDISLYIGAKTYREMRNFPQKKRWDSRRRHHLPRSGGSNDPGSYGFFFGSFSDFRQFMFRGRG